MLVVYFYICSIRAAFLYITYTLHFIFVINVYLIHSHNWWNIEEKHWNMWKEQQIEMKESPVLEPIATNRLL